MHSRQRGPGNGYRSSSNGMGGVAVASRISPDGAVRGHMMYNSEYRSYNRGFGRGQLRPFQPPPLPPSRKGDVFMEAGRLATEYLVSKGVLPENIFSGKWQNGSLKNQAGNFQGFRPQDGDFQGESRTSALSRLGDVNDLGVGSKRRFPDELNPAESRNYMRGKRRMGSFKSSGSDWDREFGRSASWSEKSGVSPDKNGHDDAFYGFQEEKQVLKDSGSGEQKSQSGEFATKDDPSGKSESPFQKSQLPGDVSSKTSSSNKGKDLPSEADMESTEKSGNMKILSVGARKVKGDGCNNNIEKQSAVGDLPFQHCAEDIPVTKNGSDLLRLCAFAKVPTKIRSSLTIKSSKAGSVSITEDENTNGIGLSLGSGAAPSDQTRKLNILDTDMSEMSHKEDAGMLDLAYALGQGKCTRSKSFPRRSFMNDQVSCDGPPRYGRCISMDSEKGEKQVIQHSPRKWAPKIDTEVNDCLHLSTSRQKGQNSQEGRNSPGAEVILAADQKNSLDISLSPNGVAKPPCIEYAEEKQLFPGSFKICDLNLMEACDLSENHVVGHVDVDLSMSNSCIMPLKSCRREDDGKDVEVIDLECDFVQDEKALNNSEQRDENLFSGLESFTNNPPNVKDIPHDQDGYDRLMISELLSTDMANCSSMPSNVTSLQNEMGLSNGEGILGDDDSIYMSLGEIPISSLHVWEQDSTQEYGKPF